MKYQKSLASWYSMKCVPVVVSASDQMKWYANEPEHFARDFSFDGNIGVCLPSSQRTRCVCPVVMLDSECIFEYIIVIVIIVVWHKWPCWIVARASTQICDLKLNCPLSKKVAVSLICWKVVLTSALCNHQYTHTQYRLKPSYIVELRSLSYSRLQNCDNFQAVEIFHSFVSESYHFQIEM